MMQPASTHSPVLRRAVMRVQPGFYSWDETRQLHYRMHMPDNDRFLLERSIFHDLYGVVCATQDALQAAWKEIPLGELDAINETLLPWLGIGEDSFYLNESMPEDDRLRFDTLDAYARDDHGFQEAARQKDDPEHVVKPYQGNLHARWARLFADGQFRYATLNSLAGHLSDHISTLGHELLDTLIPHRYVPGPDDGKPDGDCIIWDMRTDAGGLEPQLDELSSRLFRYEARRWFELLDEFDQQAGAAVYIQDIRDEVDEQLHFIFSDKSALARVRFQHFLRDCRHLERDTSELTPLEQRESDLLNEYLNKQHRDIARNFNPKVARMKKR
ncbi:MAG TPA: hypothetical protein VFG44_03445, partial [Burkholderiales bacterium]|nr:hypothetical protein [Burkholderiales bacterium]